MSKQLSESEDRESGGARKATEMDCYIGSRLRLWRRTLAVDANALAESVGITYQQLQKYEKGMNRISATRLYEISRKLKVPIDYFFVEAGVPGSGDTNCSALEEVLALATGASGPDLLKCCASIRDPSIRKALVSLMRSIAGEASANADVKTVPLPVAASPAGETALRAEC